MSKFTMAVWAAAILWLGAAGAAVAAPTTYDYAGHDYNGASISDAPGCSCYTSAMSVSGSFTVAAPLAANLNSSPIIPTSYSFVDGLATFASTDPNVRLASMFVTTDSSGNLVSASTFVELWTSGSSPHQNGDRLDQIEFGRGSDTVFHNVPCSNVGFLGQDDTCTEAFTDSNSSDALSNVQGSWTLDVPPPPSPPPAPVPTLSEWMAILFAAVTAVAGVLVLAEGRRRGRRYFGR